MKIYKIKIMAKDYYFNNKVEEITIEANNTMEAVTSGYDYAVNQMWHRIDIKAERIG